MFAHVSVWGILLGALSAMVIGALWYHKAVFGKPWNKAVGSNDAEMKKKMNVALPVLVLVSLLTAYALSLVIVYLHAFAHGSWFAAGVEASLIAWAGFALTAVVGHGMFDPRDKIVMLINSANRLVTLLAMGLIIAAFM